MVLGKGVHHVVSLDITAQEHWGPLVVCLLSVGGECKGERKPETWQCLVSGFLLKEGAFLLSVTVFIIICYFTYHTLLQYVAVPGDWEGVVIMPRVPYGAYCIASSLGAFGPPSPQVSVSFLVIECYPVHTQAWPTNPTESGEPAPDMPWRTQ